MFYFHITFSGYLSDHTANSFPDGSRKWNLFPPGNENISLLIVPPAFLTISRHSLKLSWYNITNVPPFAIGSSLNSNPPSSPLLANAV
mmetsp:Transcript_11231/g.17355  ORF Transcript_11231/g.17355 Transcript_11231/m.17355 type:complete len:88 (+) Transcript_11231:345-608(+)